MKRLLLLGAAALCVAPLASAQTGAWINEFHYDNSVPQTGDVGEFVEVVLPALATPGDYTLYLYNGSATQRNVYGTFVIGSEDCPAGASVDGDGDTVADYTIYSCATPGIQNGSPDGILLAGPDPLNPTYPLLQFLSYEGEFEAASGPAAGQTSRDVGVQQGGATPVGSSLALTGTGLAYENFAWAMDGDDTPGQPNNGQTFGPPNAAQITYSFGNGATDPDVAGHRQLGAGVAGIRVDDLAGMNLVQGIDGASIYPAQYPDADGSADGAIGPNLFTAYDGADYVQAPNTAQILQVGRGFFWYLFDQTINPDDNAFGGGTSESVALPQNQTYTGYTADGDGTSAPDYTLAFNVVGTETFYLIANPEPQVYPLNGVSILTPSGTLSDVFQVYIPGSNTYDTRNASTGGVLEAGEGAWSEVTGVTVPAVTYGYDLDAVVAAPARRAQAPEVALRLDGVTASGAETVDLAARLRFYDDASEGWDRFDASKLPPMAAPYALVAFEGTLNGEVRRQAVRSLPTLAGTAQSELSFQTTEAGTFALSAPAIPDGWSAALTDAQANVTVDLAAGSYTFSAEAGDWTERFSLVVSATATSGEGDTPRGAFVGQPWPNPTSGSARLGLRVDASERVTATVFDALGRQVAVAFDGVVAAGAEQPVPLPSDLAPGVYVVRVQGVTFAESRQFVVTR